MGQGEENFEFGISNCGFRSRESVARIQNSGEREGMLGHGAESMGHGGKAEEWNDGILAILDLRMQILDLRTQNLVVKKCIFSSICNFTLWNPPRGVRQRGIPQGRS